MLTIPLDTAIASIYSRGIPLVEGMPKFKDDFIKLFGKVKKAINERR